MKIIFSHELFLTWKFPNIRYLWWHTQITIPLLLYYVAMPQLSLEVTSSLFGEASLTSTLPLPCVNWCILWRIGLSGIKHTIWLYHAVYTCTLILNTFNVQVLYLFHHVGSTCEEKSIVFKLSVSRMLCGSVLRELTLLQLCTKQLYAVAPWQKSNTTFTALYIIPLHFLDQLSTFSLMSDLQ